MAFEVTIGIPVYNAERYLYRSIKSALSQTFNSIEFLVCDDGCTDSSLEIIKEFQMCHPRGCDIHIIHQPKNLGVGNARNRIIKEAQGEYLYFMDSDDEISHDAIELLFDAAKRNDADLVYGSHVRIEEHMGSVNKTVCAYPAKSFHKPDEFAVWAYRKYDGIQATSWNFLIKVDIYRKNNLIHQPVNFWEDFSLTIDLPTYVTHVVLLPNLTYFYYCREGSLSNYKKRDYIDKGEITKTIEAVNQLKYKSERIIKKSYFPQRMYKLIMTDFYMVGTVMQNKDVIHPSFTKRELRDVMKSPLSIFDIMKFKKWRGRNLILFFLGVLPPTITVYLIEITIRHSKIIKNIWLGSTS